PGGPHHRPQRAAHPRQQGLRLEAAPLRRLLRRRPPPRAPPHRRALAPRLLAPDYAPRDELLACLDHLLAAAGNPSLMTNELKATLADHAAGNYRVMMNLADELLTVATDRDLPRLDEKLFLDVFGQAPKPKSPSRKR